MTIRRSDVDAETWARLTGETTAPAKAKRHKYGAKRTVVDGIAFDSAKEARRWAELQLLERAGAITDLRRQVPFDLAVNGVVVCRYCADATYRENGELVVEDTKSIITRKNRTYAIKRKLMKAVHGITIREV